MTLKYYFIDLDRTLANVPPFMLWTLYYQIHDWLKDNIGEFDNGWRWEYIIGKTFPHGIWIDTEEHYLLLRLTFGELVVREPKTDYEGLGNSN